MSLGLMLTALCLAHEPANAGRMLVISPVAVESKHGGMLKNPTGAFISCNSADLGKGTFSTPEEDGVSQSRHRFTINLSNISGVDQTVNLIINGSTSQVRSFNSQGNLSPGLSGVGDTLNFPDWTSPDLLIKAHSSTVLLIEVGCNNTNCEGIVSMGTAAPYVRVSGTNVFPNLTNLSTCPGVKQICLSQETTLNLAIKVKEDRGALTGNLHTGAFRCYGMKDHFNSPPPSFALNGGRPF